MGFSRDSIRRAKPLLPGERNITSRLAIGVKMREVTAREYYHREILGCAAPCLPRSSARRTATRRPAKNPPF